MKEINECIRDIGRANSSSFLMLDLTSRFWQKKLEPDSQPLTAFTIPNQGQFHMDHITNGTIGMPCELPEANGKSALRAAKHYNLHQQHANQHQYP
jgi:hypothetical protein